MESTTTTSRNHQQFTFSTRRVACTLFLLLSIATKSSTAFHRHRSWLSANVNPTNAAVWGLMRGGSSEYDDDDEDEKKPAEDLKKKKDVNSKPQVEEEEEEEDEEDWEDAQEQHEEEEEEEEEEDTFIEEEVEDDEEEEEDDDDWTEVEVMGERVKQYEPEEDVEPEEAEEEEEVLAENDDEVIAENINSIDDEDFVDALQEGVDIGMVAASTINTDDESSSANVDRMDLADAYDEEVLAEEEDEPLSPVLATGEDEKEEPVANGNGANISPGGGEEKALAPETSEGTVIDDATDDATDGDKNTQEITEDMTQALKALKWKVNDIKRMKPEAAALVIAKSLRRPREGMPPNLCKDGLQTAGGKWKKVGRTLVPICVGAAAIYAGKDFDLSDLFDAKSSPSPSPSKVASPVVPEPTPPPPAAEEEEAEPDADEALVASIPDDVIPPTKVHSDKDQRPHSIKPNTKPVDFELDHTWLDKLITKVENAIKAILTKEL